VATRDPATTFPSTRVVVTAVVARGCRAAVAGRVEIRMESLQPRTLATITAKAEGAVPSECKEEIIVAPATAPTTATAATNR